MHVCCNFVRAPAIRDWPRVTVFRLHGRQSACLARRPVDTELMMQLLFQSSRYDCIWHVHGGRERPAKASRRCTVVSHRSSHFYHWTRLRSKQLAVQSLCQIVPSFSTTSCLKAISRVLEVVVKRMVFDAPMMYERSADRSRAKLNQTLFRHSPQMIEQFHARAVGSP